MVNWKHPNWKSPRWWARVALAVAALVCMVYAVIAVRHIFNKDTYFDSDSEFRPIPYTETVKAAISQKLDASKNIVQYSLLVLAALWGLLIAKRDEKAIVLADWPEIVMFIAANVLFALSFYCSSFYSSSMATLHSVGTAPGSSFVDAKDLVIMDFRDDRIEAIYDWQIWLWGAAVAVSAVALFSAHAIKHKEPSSAPPEPVPSLSGPEFALVH